MLLQYGPFNLNLIRVYKYDREVVYSGRDYLYTRVVMAVRAILNPGTQADVLQGSILFNNQNSLGLPLVPAAPPTTRQNPVGPVTTSPAVGPGVRVTANRSVPGVSSDEAIRHMLSQPRQQLVLSVGGVYSLVSPIPGYPYDCTYGPWPMAVNVVEIEGTRNFVVDFVIRTDVNEASKYLQYKNQMPFVLSEQWEMRHELDEHYFCKRVIEGHVIFNAAVLGYADQNGGYPDIAPDDFRRLIVHPVPTGFKREHIHVRQLEDGVTLKYTIVDRELPMIWNNSSVTKLKAIHNVRVRKAEAENAAVRSVLSGLKRIAQEVSREQADLTLGLESLVAVEAAWDSLPVSDHTVEVEVWGNKNSTRSQLESFARGIINQRLATVQQVSQGVAQNIGGGIGGLSGLPIFNPVGIDLSITHVLTGKYVHARQTFMAGPIVTGINLVANSVFNFGSPFPTSDNTGNLIVTTGSVSGPPDDGVARGTYLEACVAAALVPPNTSPELPPPAPLTRLPSAPPSTI